MFHACDFSLAGNMFLPLWHVVVKESKGDLVSFPFGCQLLLFYFFSVRTPIVLSLNTLANLHGFGL